MYKKIAALVLAAALLCSCTARVSVQRIPAELPRAEAPSTTPTPEPTPAFTEEQQRYGSAALLTDPTELALSRKLNELTDLIASCARDRAPFRLTHFAEELAGDFHSFYAACQVLPSEGRPVDPELSRARLAACDAVRVTLALVLTLVGVSAPEQM